MNLRIHIFSPSFLLLRGRGRGGAGGIELGKEFHPWDRQLHSINDVLCISSNLLLCSHIVLSLYLFFPSMFLRFDEKQFFPLFFFSNVGDNFGKNGLACSFPT